MEKLDNGVVFIAPSKQVVYTIYDVLKEMDCHYPIHEATMEDAVALANDYVKAGTKVIVSQGGTANCLRKNVNAYIIEFRYSSFDLIHTVKYAQSISPKVAIVGFESLIYNAMQIKHLFGDSLIFEEVDNLGAIYPTLKRLNQEGVGVFIGGSPVVTAAQELGAHGIYMDADKRAIRDAVQESTRVLKMQLEKEARFGTIRAILNSISEGIIGTDKEGRIQEINPNALKLLNMEKDALLGRNVWEVIPNAGIEQTLKSGEEFYGEPQQMGGNLVSVNSVPIMVHDDCLGAVVTLQESQQIQNMEHKIRKAILAKGHVAKNSFQDIIGGSAAMKKARTSAMTYAGVDSTTLIYGETGTGKELFAQSMHNASNRASNPFVAVNCAALPENLLESELFGYVRGAFTGAKSSGKVGLFEMAHTGTIFLDEISEMALSLQPRLLRVLQEKEVSRIGDDKITPVEIRVIAATNRDLMKLVHEGKFREDLYYRLSVLILELPPLRERMSDLEQLSNHIIRQKNTTLQRRVDHLSEGALELLRGLDWPGNVRQLSNVLERAMVMSQGRAITSETMAEALQSCRPFTHKPAVFGKEEQSSLLEDMELRTIREVLRETGGNRKLTAARLGISTSTLWRKMKSLRQRDGDMASEV